MDLPLIGMICAKSFRFFFHATEWERGNNGTRGIIFCGTTNLAFLPGETNSRSYLVTLKEYLLPFAEEVYNANWIFQQDGASIHIFLAFQRWFQENNVS